jgi:hypothetical protein
MLRFLFDTEHLTLYDQEDKAMNAGIQSWSLSISQLVLVRPEPPGQYTAQAAGLPDIRAAAATREEAIEMVQKALQKELAAGNLVPVQVPQEKPLLQWFGRTNPNDPNEQAYLEELERFRREDLERTLREYDQECSDSSLTPTT